jgi:hypothetical protein
MRVSGDRIHIELTIEGADEPIASLYRNDSSFRSDGASKPRRLQSPTGRDVVEQVPCRPRRRGAGAHPDCT